MTILVTGGAGFIGSAVVHNPHPERGVRFVGVDAVAGVANPDPRAGVEGGHRPERTGAGAGR